MKINLRFVCLLMMLCCTGIHAGAQQKNVEPKKSLWKRTNITPIPLFSYNRSFGFTIGAMLNAFTDINPNDTISPPTMTLVGIGYTQNKSFFLAASQRMFLQRDKWRVSWSLGLGQSNFQFFQETDELGNGVFVDYQTAVQFFQVQGLRNIKGRFYAGLKYKLSKSVTEFENNIRPRQTVVLSGFGIPVTYDSRDYVYNPKKGWNINASFDANTTWLGSDIDFSSLSLNANQFFKVGKSSVLASRFYVYTGVGDVPFAGQKVIGGKDLRGYTKGEYRSNSVMALQTEYRRPVAGKWGAVGFGGLGYAFPSNGFAASGLLPAVGLGVRYQVIPKRKMNAGFDFAVGKGDWGVYFRVGEAF